MSDKDPKPLPMPPRTVEFLLAALDVFERAAQEAARKAQEEKACR